MRLEQYINNILNKFPHVKKVIKRIYQLIMYILSPKIKSEGNIIRVSPFDKYEYFFGYYDKSPWDKTERYMLCIRAKNTWKNVAPKELAEVVLIDTLNNNKISIIGKTRAWNVQQGCMLQWLGPNFDKEIIYNDFDGEKYISKIYNIVTKKARIINYPVYTVSSDGTFAFTLDFARLHRIRPGYGYSNLVDTTKNSKIPDTPCISFIDLKNNQIKPILYYTNLVDFETRKEMINAEHKVNHIMINPSNNRFMFIHRWYLNGKKYSRLVTCDIDGSNMYNLSDDDMVSHCNWMNDKEIFGFVHKKGNGNGYYLMSDKSNKYIHCYTELCNDGHPSFSPNGKYIITDTYPNRARIQELKLLEVNNKWNKYRIIGKVFSPFKYDNDTRCDLHPRWDRKGEKICFDSVFEGKRGLYIIEIERD